MPALVAAGLLGCEFYSSPAPIPCPGDYVATFSFATSPDASVADSSTCPREFAADPAQVAQSLAFSAALHAQPDGGAALCRGVAHARPWLGSFVADHLDVAASDTGGLTPSCTCALLVVERIVGDVQRDGGVPTTFLGELVDSISPDPAGSVPDGGTADGGICGCGLPCELRYVPLAGVASRTR